MNIIKKIILIFLTIIIFLPIVSLIVAINIFKKVKIYRIPEITGGLILLYPYIVKKKAGFFGNQIHIFYINRYHQIYEKKDIYNFYWLKKIFNKVSPIKFSKEKNFIIYNFVFDYVYKLIIKLKLDYLILDIKSFRKKNNLKEKKIIDLYESIKKPLIEINNQKLNDVITNFKNFNKKDLICFCNRDTAYKKKESPLTNMDYHNFRNFKIEDFKISIKNLLEKNYFVARMGNIVEKKLELNNPNYYEFNQDINKKPELEVMLIKRSKFFVGAESGLDKIALFLNKPIVYVNVHHLLYRPHFINRCIFLPFKLFNLKNKTNLTFKQMLDENYLCNNEKTPVGLYYRTEDYINNNIKIIRNTSEEINSAIEEMQFYLKNNFELSAHDKDLQQKFWNLFGIDFPLNKTHIISPKFLRTNLDLLY
jgi:putative glycosyltransferase (TIGR04372 family)